MLTLHSARDIRPSYFTIRKAALTRLEHLDVIRGCESSRSQEGQKVVESQRRVLGALVRRRQRPRVYLHVVRRNGIEGPNRDSHDVVDHQIRKDAKIAAGLANPPRPLGSEARVEAPPHFLKVSLTMLAKRRDPVRDRPSPRALVFEHRMTITEIDRLLKRRRR